MRRLLPLVLLALLVPAAPATAQVAEVPVSIPASQPDDAGAPVALDGAVLVPAQGCPCPGVIINHGFLGRWQDNGGVARMLAERGYVVLRYSSRGFGETPGEVDLMGPKETRDLLDAVDWLNDPRNPVVGGKVVRDRIGQFGASYGGAHAWALARSGHPAVRTTIPTATWSDAYDALLPNDVQLLAYLNGFYATGFGPTGALVEGELSTTNNYSLNLHRWVVQANSGVGQDDLRAGLAERSVAGHYDDVEVPVFIVQGLNDGLFSANQAIDAYDAITARGGTARLYLGGIGHPPSEDSLDSPEANHVKAQVLEWFDHWLKGADNGIEDRPPVEVAQADYFDNRWDGTTRSASSTRFGAGRTLSLCPTGPQGGTLAEGPCPAGAPAVVLTNVPGGGGLDEEPVTGEYARQFPGGVLDARTAPAAAAFDSAPLAEPLDLAGVPSLRLQVTAADRLPAGLQGGAAAFQLDPKLYDVAPDGTETLLTRGAFAQPLDARPLSAATTHDVRFDAFGLANVVPAGHRVRLVLSTSDVPYLRPTVNPFAAAVHAGSTIELPTGEALH